MVPAMSASVPQPWTREQFFDWAKAQPTRYEFDGIQPVAMTGGNLHQDRISRNLHLSLQPRLRGSGCDTFGPNAGVATVGQVVRYPDALIACSKVDGESRLVPNVAIVFEVLSPTSGGIDRSVKLREYSAVESIRCYIVIESATVGLTVLEKQENGSWKASSLTGDDMLVLPEVGLTVPVAEFYEGVEIDA